MDLAEPDTLDAKIDAPARPPQRAAPGPRPAERSSRRRCCAELLEVAPHILPFMDAAWDAARRAAPRRQAHPVRGRAGRAARRRPRHLSLRHLVQHRGRPAPPTGSGLGPGAIGYVLGIAKAYTTRVGDGPFPTELHDEIGAAASASAATSSARSPAGARRCGWFDAVLVRQAVKTSRHRRHRADQARRSRRLRRAQGLHRLSARRRDASTACRPSQAAQARVEPVYESYPGWNETTSGARSWAELPAQAIKYVRRIEELIEAPVALLSTSPERDDTILVHDPFQD